jgi:hypothetical protein
MWTASSCIWMHLGYHNLLAKGRLVSEEGTLDVR